MSKDIIVAAYKPLRAGKILKDQVVIDMAAKYNITPARLSILWGLQHGLIVIPKSSNPKNMEDNFVSTGGDSAKISDEDMSKLDALTTDEDKKLGMNIISVVEVKTHHQKERSENRWMNDCHLKKVGLFELN